MNKIKAEIIADFINSKGNRITTFLLTYPRIIHSEVMTHRQFSRNSASSRALPFEKMLKQVETNPFVPIAFQKSHKGMQGNEYFTDYESNKQMETIWLKGRDSAIESAKSLYHEKVTKQLCNRLLEPYMYHTNLVTATEWNNFFELRCPKYSLFSENLPLEFKSKKELLNYVHKVESDEFKSQYDNLTELDWLDINKSQAEIHIQDLAEKMYDLYNENKPKLLKENEWHMPFGNKINDSDLLTELENTNYLDIHQQDPDKTKLKISVARCARLSYMTFDNEIKYIKDIELHDELLNSKHFSPFEHCAKSMDDYEYSMFSHTTEITKELGWCRNLRGFVPYRFYVD